MSIIQLDFLKTEEECELEDLRRQVSETKRSCDAVRKGMYARHNQIAQMCSELSARLQIIEKNICQVKSH